MNFSESYHSVIIEFGRQWTKSLLPSRPLDSIVDTIDIVIDITNTTSEVPPDRIFPTFIALCSNFIEAVAMQKKTVTTFEESFFAITFALFDDHILYSNFTTHPPISVSAYNAPIRVDIFQKALLKTAVFLVQTCQKHHINEEEPLYCKLLVIVKKLAKPIKRRIQHDFLYRDYELLIRGKRLSLLARVSSLDLFYPTSPNIFICSDFHALFFPGIFFENISEIPKFVPLSSPLSPDLPPFAQIWNAAYKLRRKEMEADALRLNEVTTTGETLLKFVSAFSAEVIGHAPEQNTNRCLAKISQYLHKTLYPTRLEKAPERIVQNFRLPAREKSPLFYVTDNDFSWTGVDLVHLFDSFTWRIESRDLHFEDAIIASGHLWITSNDKIYAISLTKFPNSYEEITHFSFTTEYENEATFQRGMGWHQSSELVAMPSRGPLLIPIREGVLLINAPEILYFSIEREKIKKKDIQGKLPSDYFGYSRPVCYQIYNEDTIWFLNGSGDFDELKLSFSEKKPYITFSIQRYEGIESTNFNNRSLPKLNYISEGNAEYNITPHQYGNTLNNITVNITKRDEEYIYTEISLQDSLIKNVFSRNSDSDGKVLLSEDNESIYEVLELNYIVMGEPIVVKDTLYFAYFNGTEIGITYCKICPFYSKNKEKKYGLGEPKSTILSRQLGALDDYKYISNAIGDVERIVCEKNIFIFMIMNQLYAFDIKNKKMLWKQYIRMKEPVPGETLTAPYLINDLVFVTGSRIIAFNIETGKRITTLAETSGIEDDAFLGVYKSKNGLRILVGERGTEDILQCVEMNGFLAVVK